MTADAASRKHQDRLPRRWPLLLVAPASCVAVWSGWVGLGGMAGFGPVQPLPGITEWTINTAVTLPISVEAYAAFALNAWLSRGPLSRRTRRFAARSAIGSLILGAFGQAVYHLLVAAGRETAPWPVTALVSCMPVLVLGMAAALAHMIRADATETAAETTAETGAKARAETSGRNRLETGTETTARTGARTGPETTAGTGAKTTRNRSQTAAPRRTTRTRKAGSRISTETEKAKAVQVYRASVQAGQPVSERSLGDQFGRGRTWARARIAEAQDDDTPEPGRLQLVEEV